MIIMTEKTRRRKKIIAVVISILICFLVGLTASYFQSDSMKTWYPSLNKPKLTPPDIVFPIAWNIIYLCIGTSIGLIAGSDLKRKGWFIRLFAVQLFFNFAWSILFFYFRSPLLGFLDILILDILVTVYTISSFKTKRVSSILFFPYIIWIYFATYLNGYILMYN